MSVAPLLNMCSVDAMRHLDNPSTPLDLSRTITSDIPPPNHDEFVLGVPSDGAIAKRRELARAIHMLAQRQLRSHCSGILRFDRDSRSASRERPLRSHRSGVLRFDPASRSASVERPLESSAVTTRRSQHRVTAVKRAALRRARSRSKLSGQRMLAKKASTIGSEMVFFPEFKANPRAGFMGCVVS